MGCSTQLDNLYCHPYTQGPGRCQKRAERSQEPETRSPRHDRKTPQYGCLNKARIMTPSAVMPTCMGKSLWSPPRSRATGSQWLLRGGSVFSRDEGQIGYLIPSNPPYTQIHAGNSKQTQCVCMCMYVCAHVTSVQGDMTPYSSILRHCTHMVYKYACWQNTHTH